MQGRGEAVQAEKAAHAMALRLERVWPVGITERRPVQPVRS